MFILKNFVRAILSVFFRAITYALWFSVMFLPISIMLIVIFSLGYGMIIKTLKEISRALAS